MVAERLFNGLLSMLPESWKSSHNPQFHKENCPWEQRARGVWKQRLNSACRVSLRYWVGGCLGSVLTPWLGLLPQPPQLPGQLELVFPKALSLCFLITCLWFCDVGWTGQGLGQGWAWPAPWSPFLFLDFALGYEYALRVSVTTLTPCGHTFPLKWPVIHLYFYGAVSC